MTESDVSDPLDDPSEDRRTTAPGTVTVGSGSGPTFGVSALAELEAVERAYTIACASGERTTARWTGVPALELLDTTSTPPETTHLRLASHDGYCVCLPIHDALDGIVAYARDGELLGDTERYSLRFLAADISGERLVKGLRRIEPVELDANDDPDRLETVTLDTPTY